MVAPGGGEPECVLVVDPIDGTRPALAGLEAACTSVALAPLGDGEPTMGDVVAGRVVEIKSGEWFAAERGAGCRASRPIALSAEHRPRAAVLGLRLHAPARARGGRGDRRADRPLVARRRRLRPRLGDVRPHAHPHRPARRLRRAGRAHGRRGPGHARRSSRASAAARSSTTRPTTSRPPRCASTEGGAVDHRRRREAARAVPAARLRTASSTSPASPPPRPPCTRCFSTPWNGAWSACARWISWPRRQP